jgi:hypothetical protein
VDFITLTGHRKSGTTLLHRLFDGHPEINIYPVDISLLYALYPCWIKSPIKEKEIRSRVSLIIRKSTSGITGKPISSAVMEFNPDDLLDVLWDTCNPTDLCEPSTIVRKIGESYLKYADLPEDKPFLFKETSQIVNLQSFIDNGLALKMIQIVRDPRDNYAAIKDGVSGYYNKIGEGERQSLASVLNRAKMDLELAKEAIVEKNPSFAALRFEDLLSNPEFEMKTLTGYLGISWDSCLLNPTSLGEPFKGNNHSGSQFDGMSNENIGRWRDRITEVDACLIEAWMSDIMRFWGYQAAHERCHQLRAISDFYAWYNCKYFYFDSFH